MKEIKKYLIQNYNKVKINSQNIVSGDVFVALAGENTHGSEYILIEKFWLQKNMKNLFCQKVMRLQLCMLY